jgi:hypothetical protein
MPRRARSQKPFRKSSIVIRRARMRSPVAHRFTNNSAARPWKKTVRKLFGMLARSSREIAGWIPRWAVGLTGALIAIGASVFAATFLKNLEMSAAAKTNEAAASRESISQLWQNHMLADRRETSADFFWSELVANPQASNALRPLIAHNLLGATLAMTAAAAQKVTNEAPTDVRKLDERLRNGDLMANADWKANIDALRLKSQAAINARGNNAVQLDSEVRTLRARQSVASQVLFTLTVLGLIAALLKDLPVWRAETTRPTMRRRTVLSARSLKAIRGPRVPTRISRGELRSRTSPT